MTDARREIETIGWYDGIIEALLQLDDGRWMYASMIAWSPQKKLRVFGLVEVDLATLADLRALSAACGGNVRSREEAWSALRSRVSEFLSRARGRAELWLCDELDGETKGTLEVESMDIVSMLGKEVEDTLDRTRLSQLLARFRADG